MALAYGIFQSLQHPDEKSEFFTNADGEFTLPYLGEGEFRLEFEVPHRGNHTLSVDVRPIQDADLDLGVLQIQTE